MEAGSVDMAPQPPFGSASVTPSQREVLDVLRGSPDALTVTQIADRVSRHVSTVRGHLETLAAQGLVARGRERHGVRGRPAVVWYPVSTPGRSAGELAAVLAVELSRRVADPAPMARELGHSLARGTAHDAEQLTRMLVFGGFEAELQHDGSTIVLRACPYAAAATASPEIVCAMHAGIIDGLVEGAEGESARSARLEPKARTRRCLVHLEGSGWAAGPVA